VASFRTTPFESTACPRLPPGQVLVVGKISQASVLAWAAYRDEAGFRERTGIPDAVLVEGKPYDTQVA
jgi:hypothetical protein